MQFCTYFILTSDSRIIQVWLQLYTPYIFLTYLLADLSRKSQYRNRSNSHDAEAYQDYLSPSHLVPWRALKGTSVSQWTKLLRCLCYFSLVCFEGLWFTVWLDGSAGFWEKTDWTPGFLSATEVLNTIELLILCTLLLVYAILWWSWLVWSKFSPSLLSSSSVVASRLSSGLVL